MARTKDEILAGLVAAKNADSALSTLTSTSKFAIWYLWLNIIAYAILLHELLWDKKKLELEAAADAAIAGTDKWYATKVLEWQYGYVLDEVNGKLVYTIADDDAKLVKKVATISVGGILYIKVAKGDPLEPLTTDELVSLDAYIRDIKFAGTRHVCISVDPDLVHVVATVYFDGKLDPTTFKATFEAAMDAYLKNIFFNGLFNINDYRDAGEAVIGCKDFQIGSVEIRPDSGSYIAVTLNYNPASGYFKVDPLYPYSTEFTYIPV